jgi:hypothetical protein
VQTSAPTVDPSRLAMILQERRGHWSRERAERDLDANLSPMAVAVRSGSKLWKVHSTPLPFAAETISNMPPLARTGRLMRAEILQSRRDDERQSQKRRADMSGSVG